MSKESRSVNNTFYDDLNEAWDIGLDHPIALLRAENHTRNPWIVETIKSRFSHECTILDVGCGGGLLTEKLSQHFDHIYGIDLSNESLEHAKTKDVAGKIKYSLASADHLPFCDENFDVVCAMDLLEHVDDYKKVVKECARVLKPGGLFFFHTFNRNFLSYIMIIKGVEWFVKNTPPDMHVYDKFIKPSELEAEMMSLGLNIENIQGLVPDFKSKSFFKMLFKKEVDENFRFKFIKSKLTGYVGIAGKVLKTKD